MLFPEIVIAGCGNPLFADDGFGPAVIEEMQNLSLPDNVMIVDAGLGGPHFIFTLLDPEVTKKLIIVDIADYGAETGVYHKTPRRGPTAGCVPGCPFVGSCRTAPADQGPD